MYIFLKLFIFDLYNVHPYLNINVIFCAFFTRTMLHSKSPIFIVAGTMFEVKSHRSDMF